MKRLLIALVAVVVLIALPSPLLTVAAWVGRKKLEVIVLVVDTETPEPVTGARVVAFRGPMTLFEGDIRRRMPSDLVPGETPEQVSSLTDDKGFCKFEYSFRA